MDRAAFLAKARALLVRLEHFVDRNYTDPQDVIPFFEQWLPMRETLKNDEAEAFGDLPKVTTPKSSGTTDNNGRGYVAGGDVDKLYMDIKYAIDVLTELPKPGGDLPAIAVTREGVFFSGQYFDALVRVSELLKAARKDIVLIDGYIDGSVLKLFTAKAKDVTTNVLTRRDRETPALEREAVAFNKQYGGLKIRLSNAFHDRFLFIDGAEFFHLGASVKDAGRRGFMFSKIEEPKVIEALRTEFADSWDKAENLV